MSDCVAPNAIVQLMVASVPDFPTRTPWVSPGAATGVPAHVPPLQASAMVQEFPSSQEAVLAT